jgi:sulfotransferase family protein
MGLDMRASITEGPTVGVDEFERFVFIVGAPRCGTTTLSRFLKDHPSISFPAVKEPHFFAQNDLRELTGEALTHRVEQDYLGRFFRPRPDSRVGADASVSYLYAPEQLEPILRLWPESRFVVALRDPLTMLPSLHRRLIYVGEETMPNFADAWAAVPDRAAGRKIPRQCKDARLFRYDEACRFGTYLERLFAVVGRDRCQVVIFDDLAADPAGTYERLAGFAGIEPQRGTDFAPHRSGKTVRIRWLQRMLKRPPDAIRDRLGGELYRKHIRDLENIHQRGPVQSILSVRKRLLQWNSVSVPAAPVPLALQKEIRQRFKDEIDHLGELLGRDLRHWLQPRSESSGLVMNGRSIGYRNAFSH